MLLAVDIGNSLTKFGLFDGSELTSKFSIHTNNATVDSISQAVSDRLSSGDVSEIAICSVVPGVELIFAEFLINTTGVEPLFIRNDRDFGIRVDYQPLESIGTDRLVNASTAARKYGSPVVVCGLGTATTIDAVADGEFRGGIIAPGMRTMAKALFLNTSQLPDIDITRPDNVFGTSTDQSIRSGVYWGYVGLIEGILTRMITEIAESPRVVATGGAAAVIAGDCLLIEVVDETLTLEGIAMLAAHQDHSAVSPA
ncbi:MAG: type III pantothenate kinase [Acidobacteriota bacterium]